MESLEIQTPKSNPHIFYSYVPAFEAFNNDDYLCWFPVYFSRRLSLRVSPACVESVHACTCNYMRVFIIVPWLKRRSSGLKRGHGY